MNRWRWIGIFCAVCAATVTTAGVRADAPDERPRDQARRSQQALLVQVLLDRAGFSVGEIDGAMGAKTRRAVLAFQQAKAINANSSTADAGNVAADSNSSGSGGGSNDSNSGGPSALSSNKGRGSRDARTTRGRNEARNARDVRDVRRQLVDPATLEALGGERSPTVAYEITAEDAAGPFVPDLPKDLAEQGALDALAYRSVLEKIAERFHASPKLLERLNPGVTFAQGDRVLVPDVEPMVLPAVSERRKGAMMVSADNTSAVVVSRQQNELRVEGADGRVLFYAPVSSGSERDPLPIGDWKVLDIYMLPVFHYNPDLFWDADPAHSKTTIKPGPNNPVGSVWIDIDRDHYGLHGTPEPSSVGITQSHGCVRLTNWDALRLAALVQPGTRVVFRP